MPQRQNVVPGQATAPPSTFPPWTSFSFNFLFLFLIADRLCEIYWVISLPFPILSNSTLGTYFINTCKIRTLSHFVCWKLLSNRNFSHLGFIFFWARSFDHYIWNFIIFNKTITELENESGGYYLSWQQHQSKMILPTWYYKLCHDGFTSDTVQNYLTTISIFQV